MATTYGRQLLTPIVGTIIQCLANLVGAKWQPVGITVDWSTVAAVASVDVVTTEGYTVKVGQKALPCGQVMCRITSGGTSGQWGPYDVGASDGRQTLTRGHVGILNELVIENGVLPGILTGVTAVLAVFYAGTVWKARLLHSTNANPFPALAAGPVLASLEAVTTLAYVED